MNKQQMIDIECLSTASDGIITEIGLLTFDEAGTFTNEHHWHISPLKGLNAKRTWDTETLMFWEGQENFAFTMSGTLELAFALEQLRGALDFDIPIWANSPSFDLRLLNHAYNEVSELIKSPFNYKMERDYRTLMTQRPEGFETVYGNHNALEDCRAQATNLINLAPLINFKFT